MHLLEEDLKIEGSGASLLEDAGVEWTRVEDGKGKMGMIAPYLRDGVGVRERVLEWAGRVQVCRKGHHSPATWGEREDCYFSLAIEGRAGFGCPAELRKWDGMAQKRTLLGAQTVQKESPCQSFPQHLI